MPRKSRPAPSKPLANPERRISDGIGASDDNSGGGNATGIPDADTAMRDGGSPPAGNVKEDRKKLFPEKFGSEPKKSPRSKR